MNTTQFVGIHDDRLLLTARDAARGEELWQFDGEELSFLAEINPGSRHTTIAGAVEFQGDFFFHAFSHDLAMYQMYRLEGNDVTRISPSGLINEWDTEIVLYDGAIYITGQDVSTPEQAPALWRYDGTEFELAWMPGESRYNFLSNLFVYNERLYSITHSPQFGDELWVWDGTSARMVIDLNPGPPGINGGDPFPTQFMEYNGSIFIRLVSAPGGSELWSITIPEPGSVILLTIGALIALSAYLRER